MSFTAVANMVVHDAFAQYFQRALLERSVFFKSGILASDPVIAQKCAEAGFGGNFVSLPFFNALSTSDKEERLDEHDLVPSNVTTGEDVAVIVRRGKAFGANDLATDVAGADPMKTVADQLADYWNARNERRLFSVLKGVFAKNVSADSSSLVLDITGEEGEKAILSKDTLLWAAQLLGDHKTDLTAIACNSVVDTYLAAMDTNAGLYRASEGAATLPSYNGRSLIIDDLCGYNAETKVAEIYLFGRGAIAYNPCPVKVPFEVGRDALKAGGRDYLVSRQASICHLRGYKWGVTDIKPYNADADRPGGDSSKTLENPASWTRVYDAKEIRCVKLVAKLAP